MHTGRGCRAGSGARALATALLALFAVVGAQAQSTREERLCQSMARHLERLEASPRTRPETLEHARQQYRQRCEGAVPAPAAAAAVGAAPVPPPAAPPQRTPPATAAKGGTVSEAEARARLCETDARLPFCGAAAALPGGREQPYWRWQSQAYSQCVGQPAAGRARDHCARSVVERALSEGRVAAAAVDACRASWQGGERSEPEMMAVDQCLLAAALLEQAASSRVAEAAAGPAPGGPPGLNLQGLSRADLVAPLYAGDLAKVPAGAEDLRYMLTSFGRLNESCPNLGLAGTAMQIAQAQARQTQEAVARGLSGRGSAADAVTALGAANEMMKTLPDCERIVDDPPRREACIAERDSAFQVQRSPAAVADATRLIERHGCGSAQMTRYAQQLAAWLLAPPGSRGSLAGLDKHPQAPALARLFDSCRRQAGSGVADAWCGCYVRHFANSPRGTRSAPAEVLDAAAHGAFIGGPQAWYAPPDIGECDRYWPAVERWRREQAAARPLVTACLVQQQPAEVVLAPGMQLCRYRSGVGVVELRAAQCPARLHAHEWGSEAVPCGGAAGGR